MDFLVSYKDGMQKQIKNCGRVLVNRANNSPMKYTIKNREAHLQIQSQANTGEIELNGDECGGEATYRWLSKHPFELLSFSTSSSQTFIWFSGLLIFRETQILIRAYLVRTDWALMFVFIVWF